MAGQTPIQPIRVPRSMWAAYGRVCARLGRDRTEDLLEHMRRQIRRHGDDADKADLAAAEERAARAAGPQGRTAAARRRLSAARALPGPSGGRHRAECGQSRPTTANGSHAGQIGSYSDGRRSARRPQDNS